MFLCLLSFASCQYVDKDNIGPNSGQQAMIDRKYGMFLHYGMNTYLGVEWSNGKTPASKYNPPADIAEKAVQWVKNAKNAGMRSVVLTTKHHDGFCLWDSKFTDYDIANPDIVNKVDIVKTVADACKKENIAFSVYYSLWDRHEPSYRDKDPYKYIQFMKNQLGELMTNYGTVSELWFDGAWDRKVENWYLQEVYDYVKSLQPDCQISTNHTIGKRPVDMQYGDTIKYFPSDFRLWDPYLPMIDDNKIYTHNGKKYYLPYECTQTISVLGNWFHHPNDTTVRDLDELEEIFYVSTINDNCLLLNIPPDMNGIQNPRYIQRINELASRLKIENGNPFPEKIERPVTLLNTANVYVTSVFNNDTLHYGAKYAIDSDVSTCWQGDSVSSITVELDKILKFNNVNIISGRGSIIKYVFEIFRDDNWYIIDKKEIDPDKEPDSFMGYGFINISSSEILKTDKLRLNILASDGKPKVYSLRIK